MPDKAQEQNNGIFVKAPVVDRLVFILPWNVGLGVVDAIPEKVKKRVDKMIEKRLCTKWFHAGSRFRLLLRVPLPSGAKAQVHLGAKNLTRQKGGLRIDINPAKMTAGDVEHLHTFVRKLIGQQYEDLLTKASISRIDVAVDIVNCLISNYLISYRHGHELTMFGKRVRKDMVETINFGSVKSAYRAAVYDKRLQNLDQALKELIASPGVDDELADNLIRQVRVAKGAPPIMRVEIRGVKLGRTPVCKLLEADKQRFERFTFTELASLDQLTDFTKLNFLALVKDVGLKAAKKAYRGHAEAAVIETITASSPSWWKPNRLWARGVRELKGSGIFPKPAFESPFGR